MIQRKQTLWFLLSTLAAVAAFFIPFGFKNTTSISSYQIDVHDFTALTHPLLIVLFALIIAVNLACIFLFKNRPLQIKLAFVNLLISVAALGYEIFFSTRGENHITLGIANATLYIGLLFPLLTLVFTFMGLQGVKSDVKLLEESNRLR